MSETPIEESGRFVEVKCSNCEGTGVMKETKNGSDGYGSISHTSTWTCTRCNGSGKVLVDRLAEAASTHRVTIVIDGIFFALFIVTAVLADNSRAPQPIALAAIFLALTILMFLVVLEQRKVYNIMLLQGWDKLKREEVENFETDEQEKPKIEDFVHNDGEVPIAEILAPRKNGKA